MVEFITTHQNKFAISVVVSLFISCYIGIFLNGVLEINNIVLFIFGFSLFLVGAILLFFVFYTIEFILLKVGIYKISTFLLTHSIGSFLSALYFLDPIPFNNAIEYLYFTATIFLIGIISPLGWINILFFIIFIFWNSNKYYYFLLFLTLTASIIHTIPFYTLMSV